MAKTDLKKGLALVFAGNDKAEKDVTPPVPAEIPPDKTDIDVIDVAASSVSDSDPVTDSVENEKNEAPDQADLQSTKASKPRKNKESKSTPMPTPGTSRKIPGEILKNTPFNLPVSLIERIENVANVFHAGNKSHFARYALEIAVAEAEKRISKG